MAEFKLGRIKFVYQGAWATGTAYVIDDVVTVGGKTYICTVSHTAASAFGTDLNHNPTYWNLVSDGSLWRGAWTASTFYNIGDLVQYGGTVYACNTAHTSATYVSPTWYGLENSGTDTSKWTVFATAFSWAGAWATSTRYRVRDIVYYGGVTYVCKTAHISDASATNGLEQDQGKWDLFNQGFNYIGAWSGSSVRYKLNDIVKFGPDLYICTGAHTSTGATIDTGNFSIFVNGFEFVNSWSSSTNYAVGDTVSYGGYTYISIQNGINQTPSTATGYWQPFTVGFSFQGDWSSATSYKTGHVVRLGGYTYVAIVDNSVQTLTITGTTISTDGVTPNQITTSGNTNVLALNLPITFGSAIGGLSTTTTYYVKSIVDSTHFTVSTTAGGTVFSITSTTSAQSVTATTNPSPPYATYWNRLASGIRWNATGSTYTNVAGSNIIGSGSNATFDVTRVGTGYTVVKNVTGSGYAVSDTIKILGSSLGGLTPSNDLTITITGVTSTAVNTFTVSGYAVTWTSGTTYVQGDAVYFGPNTYICITAHVGASGNRPDADTAAVYWNILALGAESASLTTQGDIFYYGNNGPQRLPIGTDGQVLRVNGNAPAWSYYGLVNNVVFVSPTGTDIEGNGNGLTLDKPWKSVRFAAEQVEDGYQNLNAKKLLRKNKQFLIKEVNNYIQNILTVSVTATSNSDNSFTVASTSNLYVNMPITFTGTGGGVTVGTTYYIYSIISGTKFSITASYPSGSQFGVVGNSTNTGTYAYSPSKTERDAGIILDALVYDLSHGGNSQTTAATLAYYSTTSASSYVSGVYAYDIQAFTKALTYMTTLTGNVLANTAPASNYQALNGISSGNRAIQNIDSTLTAESGTATTVASLISLITNGLSAGTTNSIAAAINSNTTVSIKTGTYNEVLPIVVQKNVAMVGDELRSTVIQPASANLNLIGDKPKTISSLNRVKAVLSTLVANSTVTPTTGNTQTQITSLPAGDVGSSTAVTSVVDNATLIQNIISTGLNQVPAFSFTNPTGYNTSYLVGFGDGKAQLIQNYEFIKQEIAAYLNANYSTIWTTFGSTNQTESLRDVMYVLDGILYDMTYGCNNQSIINGSAYYSLNINQILTAYLPATLAALGRLQTVVSQVIQKTSVTTSGSLPSGIAQVTSGTAGSAAAGAFASARVADVSYWLTNGAADTTSATFTGTTTTTTLTVSNVTGTIKIGQIVTGGTIAAGTYITAGSGTTWTISVSQSATATGSTMTITPVTSGAYALASSALQASYTALQGRRSEIALDAQAWVAKNYQAFNISSTLTNRDAGYVVDALSWDLLLGSNVASISAGRAYYRLNSSAQALIANTNSELTATTGAINFIAYKSKGIAAAGSAVQAGTIIDDAVQTIYGTGSVTPTTVTTSTNVITVSSTTGMAIGMPIVFNGLPANIATTATATTTSTNVITLGATVSSLGIATGQQVYFTGVVFGNIVANQMYYVASASASSITVSLTFGGSAVTLITASGTMNVVVNAAGGLWNNNIYYVKTIPSGTTLTISSSSAVATAYTITNTVSFATASGATSSISSASSGSVAGNVLTIGGSVTGTFAVGMAITGTGVISGTYITALGTGTGGAGTYTVSIYQVVATTAITGSPGAVWGAIAPICGSGTYNNTLTTVNGSEILRANITFLAYEAAAYTSANFGGTVTTTTSGTNLITTSSSHNLVVGDPVAFSAVTVNTTATASSGNNITVNSTVGIVPGMPVTFNSTLGNIVAFTTYFVLTASGNTLTIASSYANYQGSTPFSVGTTTSQTVTVTAGGIFGGLSTSTTYYVLTAPSTTTFTVTTTQSNTTQTVVSLTSANGVATATYSYNLTKCVRDMTSFINAIVNDIQYPGNYKMSRAATLYVNAVGGSQLADMFYLRQSTGVRNMTMTGLTGALSPVNQYGTKRPTAGAYSSLDPGYGPNDANVWIITRSPYTQNCTMFGTACTGLKIDGALHTYGNKSIVANDYTTIISDGIGAWCTGSGSLTELVSVFNYYGYSGYLAELGGRIRATNGNSSYGTYGVVAEGTDSFENAIAGTVNNRYFQAQVTNVITDGINQVLRLEYQNSGSNYSNSTPTISGSGYNISVVQDEFRDSTVIESRLVDLNDGKGSGGSFYVTASNTVQAGTATSVTIAATDTALSAAYVGMRIQIVVGSGTGQYANILTYNNGTKIALVYKDSFTNLTVTGSTTTQIVTSSTATLYVNMPIIFSATTAGILTANTVYYVAALSSGTNFTVKATTGGSAITGLTATSAQTITLYAAGWDHTVPGTAIVSALDLSSQYIIEPRVSYTAPGYTATARTLSATATWSDVTFGDGKFVAVATGGTATSYSSDGKTWSAGGALPASSTWNDVVYAGGQYATAVAVVGGLGGSGATFTATIGTAAANATQIIAINVVTGGFGYTTAPTLTISGGGGSGCTATAIVLNGSVVAVTVNINGSGYSSQPTITARTDLISSLTPTQWGRNYQTAPTVTVSGPFSGSAWASSTGVSLNAYLYYNNSGTINWYQVTTAGTTGVVAPTHTTGAVANGGATLTYAGTSASGTAVLTNNGVSSITITNVGYGYTSTPTVTIVDSTAKFVAIRSGAGAASAYSTTANLGSAWTAGNTLQKTDLLWVAWGGGFYVAVGGTSGTASAVSSTDGITWTDRSSAIIAQTGSGFYSSVCYGASQFVAISSGTQITAYSTSGATWTQGGNLPTGTTWNSVAFGNNRLVALATDGSIAYSLNNATTWVAASAPLSSSYTWTQLSYGQGLFFAIASGTQACATSPDGINWTLRTTGMSSSSNWNDIIFGNPISTTLGAQPLWVAVSNTSGSIACSIKTGPTPLGRLKVVNNAINEARFLEPGSGFPKGNVTNTTVTTNLITVDDTTNLVDSQPIVFTATGGGLTAGTYYYVIGSTITSTQFKVSAIAGSATAVTLSTATITGTYRASPIVTQFDPNRVNTAPIQARMGDGALGNPTFVNRGSGNQAASAIQAGDGYADLFQPGTYVNVSGLYSIPQGGSNVQFSSIPGVWYKLVLTGNTLGSLGGYSTQFQISPALTILNAPIHGTTVTTRLKYSQVRLTGHDFLYIGVGNYTATNYPYVNASNAIQANQQLSSGGGRVFFTSTDQDGNFNVGNLFGVQQATGTATLNATAFNLAGLQSLTLGAVTLGVGSATITSFSTDPYFTANSDNILPTQRAIKSYITSQIGGGLSTLNVNTLTAGVIYIANNTITTTTGGQINVNAKMNFTGGIDGSPVALVWFGQR
jgi:hypothetical protein